MTSAAQQHLDGYRRLVEIARDLASTFDIDILLARIIQAAAEVTGSETASILLYDQAADQLYFQVSANIDQLTMDKLVVPMEGSVAGWIVTNRKPVRIDDVGKDPRHFTGVGQATRYAVRSLLGVPLIHKDRVVGVLEALNKKKGRFTATDEDLLQVLGAQAAVALENTRLFHQSDLISEFVHELRTPLASLSTATYLLLRPEISQQQRDQIIHSIHGETLRLNALASSFLDLARLESGRVQYRKAAFPVAPVLTECLEVMTSKAAEERVSLELDVPGDLPQLQADRDKIKQVVLNLLSNAIKYNHAGGKVTVGARMAAGELRIIVKDTGVGIPPEALQHLGEKFFRVRESEGKATDTGLGLSICRKIVQGHGGRMEVESKVGDGTTITVVLPLK